MFEQISKEEAIEIAKEFNRTHSTKLKYITKNSSGVWEGWERKPTQYPDYWGTKSGICIPVILSPIMYQADWIDSLTTIESE